MKANPDNEQAAPTPPKREWSDPELEVIPIEEAELSLGGFADGGSGVS